MPKSRSLPSYKIHQRWSVTDARAALTALANSGLSPSAFAIREGLDVQRLQRWRGRLGAMATTDTVAAPAFVELRSVGAESVEIVLRSGRVLRVSETIDAGALRRLVEALEPRTAC
jgi:hypothetical protein